MEQSPDTPALASVHTQNLPALLRGLNCSLVVTTYQAGRVIIVRAEQPADGGAPVLNTHFRLFDRPMGASEKDGRLAIGGTNTVWEYRDVPAAASKLDGPAVHDACYVPRSIHFTGNIDIHEVAWAADHRLWLVNTRFSCLCTLDPDNSFHPRWRPGFVTAYAPEDRCHLNGLAMRDGEPRYVTALGETDSAWGWRANKPDGGVLMSVQPGDPAARVVHAALPPVASGQDLVARVRQGIPGRVRPGDARVSDRREIARLHARPRFHRPLAFVGLSKVRETATFSGLPIVDQLPERTCGVWVVHVETGAVVAFLRFESGVEEIFAVQVMHGAAFPELLEPGDPQVSVTYVLPDEAMREVSRDGA